MIQPLVNANRSRKTSEEHCFSDIEAILSRWYRTELGERLIERERTLIKQAISGRFGSSFAQMDSGYHEALFERRLFGTGFLVSPSENRAHCPVVCADFERLPFEPGSLDMVLMHHTLDICQDPYQSLRESAIALKPGGLLIVIGFNPISAWGMRHLLSKHSHKLTARLIQSARVEDWMHLLGFEIEQSQKGAHIAPYGQIMKSSLFERFQKKVIPWSGAVYSLVGYKQVPGRISSQTDLNRQGFLAKPVSGSQFKGSNIE